MSTVQIHHLGPPTRNLHLTAPQAPYVPLHGFLKAGFGPQGLFAGIASRTDAARPVDQQLAPHPSSEGSKADVYLL